MAWGGTGWFNPTINYGGVNPDTGLPQNWYTTPTVIQDPNVKYRGEWERFLADQGVTDIGRQGQTIRNMFPNAANAYEAVWQSNPNLTFREYLAGLGPGFLQNQIATMTPQQRGDFLPGQTRWIRW